MKKGGKNKEANNGLCIYPGNLQPFFVLFHAGSLWSEKCCQKLKELKSGSTNTSFLPDRSPLLQNIAAREKENEWQS